MPSIGALDLGYGSGLQIVKTNYLLTTEGALTAASTNLERDGAKNLLSLAQKHFGDSAELDYKNLRPDYVVVGHSKLGTAAIRGTIAGTGATVATGTADAGVITADTARLRSVTIVGGGSSGTNGAQTFVATGGGATTQATFANVTISGSAVPTATSQCVTAGTGYTSIPTITIATIADYTYTVDTILEVTAPVAGPAHATSDANPEILAVLGVGGVELTTNAFDASTALVFTVANVILDTPAAKDGNIAAAAGSIKNTLNSNLLTAAGNGKARRLEITDAIDPVEVELGHPLDLSQANLNASFVEQGNTAGTTATELSDVLTASQNQLGILTVTTLCRSV